MNKKVSNKESGFIKYFGGLLMEQDRGKWSVSVGRVSWWICLIPALYIWCKNLGEQDITDNHLTTLIVLATYITGTKALKVVKSKFDKRDRDFDPDDYENDDDFLEHKGSQRSKRC